MIENFSDKQKQIIQKASGLVKAARRNDFVKFVEDVLRAKSHPLTNTDIRHACSASLLKFNNRRS
jgi:hypothetical protein